MHLQQPLEDGSIYMFYLYVSLSVYAECTYKSIDIKGLKHVLLLL